MVSCGVELHCKKMFRAFCPCDVKELRVRILPFVGFGFSLIVDWSILLSYQHCSPPFLKFEIRKYNSL